MSQDWFADVLEFHQKLAPQLVGTTPAVPGPRACDLRMGMVTEEFEELGAAWNDDDLPQIADALADLVYVVLGMAVSYGIDLRPVWDAVHRANISKEGGGSRPDGKLCKPVNWVPPDVAGILSRQGPIGEARHD